MTTINGRACIVNGTPVDKVFSDGKQVYGRNLLTGTGYHTVTGQNTYGHLFNENDDDLITVFKGLEGQTVTVSVDYEYSGFVAGSGKDRMLWEIGIVAGSTSWIGAWYIPNNDSGSGRISSTFVVLKNITGVNEGLGYVQFSGSGTGTLSNFKLEKGSVATDWSPAPEDVLKNYIAAPRNLTATVIDATTEKLDWE